MVKTTAKKEIKISINKIKEQEKAITASKQSARKFLHDIGFYTKKGRLKKAFQ